MAYPCILWLKNECDGCGACETERMMPGVGGVRISMDEPEPDPFERDEEDDQWRRL